MVKKKININSLYPLEKLESLDAIIIEKIKNQQYVSDNKEVQIIRYKNISLILNGIYEVIYQALQGQDIIDVIEIDRKTIAIWSKDQDLDFQLRCLGVNALYDFEAVTGIVYSNIPKEYKGV